MIRKRVFAYVVALGLAAASAAPAQQPAAGRKERAAGGLAVEIVHEDGRRTFIPGNETVWFSRFRAVEGWQRPAHIPPVRAVQIASRVETEDSLHITVSVHLGVRHFDEERTVTTFVARAGDALVAEGLREFGVVPVGLKVVRARAPAPAPPFVETATASLELLAVEPADVSFPSYNLRLRNHSAKAISALEILYVTESDGHPVHWRHNPQNEPLAAPGAIFDLNIFGGNQGEVLTDGYAPDRIKAVRINTVVFSDGTFEGDARGRLGQRAVARAQGAVGARASARRPRARVPRVGRRGGGVQESPRGARRAGRARGAGHAAPAVLAPRPGGESADAELFRVLAPPRED